MVRFRDVLYGEEIGGQLSLYVFVIHKAILKHVSSYRSCLDAYPNASGIAKSRVLSPFSSSPTTQALGSNRAKDLSKTSTSVKSWISLSISASPTLPLSCPLSTCPKEQ